MSAPMTYLDFIESTRQNKIHFVSGASVPIKGFGLAQEPLYALESSGSVSSKVYIHGLSSINAACEAFFKTFKMTESDKWGLCLTTSHVAGFSVLARSHFGKLQDPHLFSWSKETLVSEVVKNNLTVLSLVPTQIYDLVKIGVQAPKNLRMVFVGGAKLQDDLRDKAVRLGWPILECYGSTETFAQMSYSIDGEGFSSFEGWALKILDDDEICVSGPGLFLGQVVEGIFRSRKDEWFKTGDLGKLQGKRFFVQGKKEGLIKIKGSYFDFNRLKSEFQTFLIAEGIDTENCFLVCLAEKRDGAGIYMVSTSKNQNNKIFDSFKEIKGAFYLRTVEMSALGKLKLSNLSDALQKTVLSL